MTAAGLSEPGGSPLSIGSVLDALRADFPEITISKIRFLESEGLIRPARTPAGYRQFSHADVVRLRFVLSAQRDHYLPLKVIRARLDEFDRNPVDGGPTLPGETPGGADGALATAAPPESGGPRRTGRPRRPDHALRVRAPRPPHACAASPRWPTASSPTRTPTAPAPRAGTP